MLERIRRGTQSGLSYILVGVLIVFFAVFFGVPADGCRAGDGQRVQMARVAGTNIHTEDVNAIYYRYFGGQRTGATLDDEFFGQQAQALKVVITTVLLAERAREAGLRVSDQEFANYITDPNRNVEFLSAYGRTGQFDGPFYERYVQHGLRVPIPSYEDFKRQELLARKYMVMLDMQAHATDDEIAEQHQLKNTRVDLEFVKFSEDALTDLVGLDDDAIADFVADPDQQERLEEYFEEHRSDYEEPEELKLRTVRIFKPADEDDVDEAEEARQQFEKAQRRIVDEGEDFGTVASELSQDFYRDQGGLMDWNSVDNIDQTLAQAVDDADVGEVRETESDHAYVLVKVEDRREEEVADLDEVQEEIAEILLRRDVLEIQGAELAETLHDRVTEGLSLREALDELEAQAREEEREDDAQLWGSLSVDTTGFFNLEGEEVPAQFGGTFGRAWDEIPELGQHRDLAVQAFRLSEEEPLIDHVVEFPDSLAVVRLHEREEAPDEVSDSERAEMALEARNETVNELLGPWHFFFTRPTEDYGHYIESVLHEAMDEGEIRLYERNSRAAEILRQMLEAPQRDAPDDITGDMDLFGGDDIDLEDLEGETE